MTKVEGRELSVESRRTGGSVRAVDPQPSTLNSQPRSGLTLIELLVTITIISILATILLGVGAVAADTAREARTKIVITRIHTLLMEHYDSFKSRRVRLHPDVETLIRQQGLTSSAANAARAEARLYALREMMLMEMPDRWSDVYLDDISQPDPAWPVFLDVSGTSDGRTGVASAYLRRLNQLRNSKNSRTMMTNTDADIVENQSAECLYMIVMLATDDGEARSQFGERDIGDTDGDGAPEFIDGWGRPISFLRWAPGFQSDRQMNANQLSALPADQQQTLLAGDHDPFDMYRRETNAYRLVPLIYSSGNDGVDGIANEPTYVTWRKPGSFVPNNVPPFFSTPLTPFAEAPTGPSMFMGTILDINTATDNVHNHFVTGE